MKVAISNAFNGSVYMWFCCRNTEVQEEKQVHCCYQLAFELLLYLLRTGQKNRKWNHPIEKTQLNHEERGICPYGDKTMLEEMN